MTIRIAACTISLGITLGLSAQTGVVTGPSAGLVFDATAQTVRPIRGIPGAATFGGPIDAGYKFAAAWVSPGQESMFGRDAAGTLHFFNIGAAGVAEAALNGVSVSPERVVYSPSGTAAALYSAGQVQMVTGLPGSPQAAPAFTLGHSVRNPKPAIGSMAVSDDGAYLLFAAGGSIQLANASQGSHVLLSAGFGASVAFAPGGHDAAAAAPGTGVVAIRDAANTAAQQVLAADDPAFAQIAGVAFSTDGQSLFVASAAAKSVIVLDSASGARTDFACSFVPSGITRMGSAFRLNDFSTGPLWLLDTTGTSPRVLFVPAWKEGL